jgi:hypothetical protein
MYRAASRAKQRAGRARIFNVLTGFDAESSTIRFAGRLLVAGAAALDVQARRFSGTFLSRTSLSGVASRQIVTLVVNRSQVRCFDSRSLEEKAAAPQDATAHGR